MELGLIALWLLSLALAYYVGKKVGRKGGIIEGRELKDKFETPKPGKARTEGQDATSVLVPERPVPLAKLACGGPYVIFGFIPAGPSNTIAVLGFPDGSVRVLRLSDPPLRGWYGFAIDHKRRILPISKPDQPSQAQLPAPKPELTPPAEEPMEAEFEEVESAPAPQEAR